VLLFLDDVLDLLRDLEALLLLPRLVWGLVEELLVLELVLDLVLDLGLDVFFLPLPTEVDALVLLDDVLERLLLVFLPPFWALANISLACVVCVILNDLIY